MAKMWVMPDWMEPYRSWIEPVCDESVEGIMADTTPVQINAPRAMMMCGAKERVCLLEQLHTAGKLV